MNEEMMIRQIISSISPFSNKYNTEKNSLKRLIAMWEIGEILIKHKVKSPHQIGWKIQELTKGIIKRPLIFRSYKIRIIWPSKEKLINECQDIKSVSNVIEMLPFLDPEKIDMKPPKEEIIVLRKKMVSMNSEEFKNHLKEYKRANKEFGVGGTNIRDHIIKNKKHVDLAKSFQKIEKLFYSYVISSKEKREQFREKFPPESLLIFHQNCQSIASGTQVITNKLSTNDIDFDLVYSMFHDSAILKTDTKRARIRRVIDTERIINIGLAAYALSSEERMDEIQKTKKLQRILLGG